MISQKDSRATAKLTRNANLLAKAGVIFLPVTLMTSYFSIQIPNLMNDYTAATYWGAFAVVAGISIIGLLFFSKLLMVVSDYLDSVGDRVFHQGAAFVARRNARKREAKAKVS